MPVYNASRFLREAVESVLSQQGVDLELVVVDDGSTDGSLAVLREFAACDGRVQVLSRSNTGIVGALNDGLAICREELVARMDADDIMVDGRLQRQAKWMEEHPGVVCVGGGLYVIDQQGRRVMHYQPPLDHETIDQQLLEGRCVINHPSCMYRRSAVLQVGGYRPEAQYVEDLDLWLRLAEIGRLANLPEATIEYRSHGSSICDANSGRQRELGRRVVAEAMARRGLNVAQTAPERVGAVTWEIHEDVSVQRGWWAFNHGYGATARAYGLKAVGERPLSIAAWRVLLCSWLKRPGCTQAFAGERAAH